MLFPDFYGNEAAKSQLAAAFGSGRVPHALLLDGPEGSGRRTLARIVARAFVCRSAGERPCGVCSACRKALAGGHPDIILAQAEGGVRSFSVDTVRRLRLDAEVAPNEAACKVYILADIHLMTEQAQNALLKIIEEPPAHVRFLLTCDGRSRVLETVRSRCVVVPLGPVKDDLVVQALEKAVPGLAPEQAKRASQLAGGLIGRALQGLEKGSFSAAVALAGRFAGTLCTGSLFDFVGITGELEKDAALRAAFLELLPLLLRDALAGQNGIPTRLSGCGEEAGRLARTFTRRALAGGIQLALAARAAAERYANPRLLMTWLFASLWQAMRESPRTAREAGEMAPFRADGANR